MAIFTNKVFPSSGEAGSGGGIIQVVTAESTSMSQAPSSTNTWTDNSYILGSSSKRWANVYSADLQLSNIGTGGNEVDGTEVSWTLQEAEDTVYMINRISGKRYKIKMEEV